MKIGFVGLGRMGSHMARNRAKAGHAVAAFDVVPEAVAAVAETPGIRAATSVADAARDADVVCASLPSPQAVALAPELRFEGGLVSTRCTALTTAGM